MGDRVAIHMALLIAAWPAIAAAQGQDSPRIREAATRGFAAIQAAQKASRSSLGGR
jgi:hypothetical protein